MLSTIVMLWLNVSNTENEIAYMEEDGTRLQAQVVLIGSHPYIVKME